MEREKNTGGTNPSVENILEEFRKKRARENNRLREEIAQSRDRRQREIDKLLGREAESESKAEQTTETAEVAECKKPEEESWGLEETGKKETGLERKDEEEAGEEKESRDEPEEPKEEKEEEGIIPEEILAVLRDHPEGIKLSAIAEELGVHHIAIVNQVRGLMESGEIKKEDGFYRLTDGRDRRTR